MLHEIFLLNHERSLERPTDVPTMLASPERNHAWQGPNGETAIAVLRDVINPGAAWHAIRCYLANCPRLGISPFAEDKAGNRGVDSVLFGSWIPLFKRDIQPIADTNAWPHKRFSAAIRCIATIVCTQLKEVMPRAFEAMTPVEKLPAEHRYGIHSCGRRD